MRMKIMGFIPITKNQFIIFETIFFSFFFLLTIFFFAYDFPEYVEDPLILFHVKYLKYITLAISFFVVVETQYYLNKFISKQLKINEKQKGKIEYQNQEITQSIIYASRIQEALLPSEDKLPEGPDYFIFYKPKDIVSGDYYWFTEKNEKLIIVAADCTGHGVPGAFMSILGITSLNDIITEYEKDLNADEILNILRDRVTTSLKKSKGQIIAEAGMDLALIIIDKKNRTVQFSGANNPLFLIRKEGSNDFEKFGDVEKIKSGNYELFHFKPDKMPIGIYPVSKPFNNYKFEFQKDDTLYIFSDGFADQMGGEQGKKLLNKRFKAGLLKMQDKSMQEQKNILDKFLVKWKNGLEQTDDILIFGIKV
ncbi:MAG: SpoIIE family protein phosphatase [Bacteroidales bacterium]|nr:SpoIIE family protein phosphatase [Bacteroidales bacterium]